MAQTYSRPPQQPFEARRGEVERSYAMSARTHEIFGFVDLIGAGESTLEVNFPVWFIERPLVFGGGELGPNELLVAGSFPTWNVGVARWNVTKRGTKNYFTGALLIFVCSGDEKMRSTIHWCVKGKALRNPLDGPTDVNATI